MTLVRQALEVVLGSGAVVTARHNHTGTDKLSLRFTSMANDGGRRPTTTRSICRRGFGCHTAH